MDTGIPIATTHEDEIRDWSDISAAQEVPKKARKSPEAVKEIWDFS